MTSARKEKWSDLAIHGGEPAFPDFLHVGRPNVGDRTRFLERIDDALDRRWLSNNGPYVQQLEERLAQLCGVRHCVAVANGTLALALAAAVTSQQGVVPNPKVLLPSLTFIATAHAFHWLGIEPVFLDIDPETLTLSPDRVREHLQRYGASEVMGICGVHLFGEVGGAAALEDVAEAAQAPLLFDASHALTNAFVGERGLRRVGQFGAMEAFSLHATKFVGCGEGGAVVTNDQEAAEALRQLRNFGYASDGLVKQAGMNAKMSELAAAMGLSMLEQVDRFIASNRANYEAYREHLQPLPGIRLRPQDCDHSNCQYVVIEVDPQQAGLHRDALVGVLRAERVLARPYFSPPCHQTPPYQRQPQGPLPVTEHFAQRLLALPTGETINDSHIEMIAHILKLATIRAAKAA